MLVGYKLLGADGTLVQSWGGKWGECPGVPNPILLPNGDQVHGLAPGDAVQEWTLTPWEMDPPTDPQDFPLTQVQFMALIGFANLRQPVLDAIAKIPDAMQRAAAQAHFDYDQKFMRDNALLAQVAGAAGINPGMLDTYWMQATKV